MNNRGIIFDIQRFSLFDGPGIRTTIFLKGCPLSCVWCHNPESQCFEKQLSYDRDKCVDCFNCVENCKNGVHIVKNGKHVVDFEKYQSDNDCIDFCQNKSLKIIGREITVDQAIFEVKKDLKYYKNSGGLTLSGGEPMSQFDFSLELCKMAKEAGIHVCMETSGYGRKTDFEKILPYVDLFLFDYKLTDRQKHKEYIGVTNELILDNFQYLYNYGADIIIRTPIIPMFNDTDQHFIGIGELSKNYKNLVGIELMFYHNMGKCKAVNIGKEYIVTSDNLDEATKDKYLSRIIELGCDKNLIMN